VRDLAFWNRDDVQTNLVQVLTFLSNDTWAFTFVPWEQPELVQGFLELGDQEDWPFRGIERVVMFSGGLDSLAGVVDSLARGEQLVLVSHRPVAAQSTRQRDLYCALEAQFPRQTIHVPVWLNKQHQDPEATPARSSTALLAYR
jgi:hypothetical protein